QFTGLSYQEADILSKDNKEFIHALFPDDPIHTELLPEDVRAVIGQVGAETKAVEAMLRRIGFDYADQIDPFDGGPHFVAKTDDTPLADRAHGVRVRPPPRAPGRWAIAGVELPNARPAFRAIGTRVEQIAPDIVGLPDDARRRLGVEDGHKVWLAYG